MFIRKEDLGRFVKYCDGYGCLLEIKIDEAAELLIKLIKIQRKLIRLYREDNKMLIDWYEQSAQELVKDKIIIEFNADPRGWSLKTKLNLSWMKQDWGGFGLICPFE